MELPGGSAPVPPFPAWSDPWISPAVAFPFPLAFVAQPSYTYLVPFNLPSCQLFQPSHYFYGSFELLPVERGRVERSGVGRGSFLILPCSSMPPFIQPLRCLVSALIRFAIFPH